MISTEKQDSKKDSFITIRVLENSTTISSSHNSQILIPNANFPVNIEKSKVSTPPSVHITEVITRNYQIAQYSLIL